MALAEIKRFNIIQYYFPLRGHSFLPNDRDFGVVKKFLAKHDRIYLPKQVCEIIIKSSSSQKFTVTMVDVEDVIDFKDWWPRLYKKIVNSVETENLPRDKRIPFHLSTFRYFRYSGEFPGTVVASSFIAALLEHTFILRTTGKRHVTLPHKKAYDKRQKLSEAKLSDLKKILQFIPEEFKSLYTDIFEVHNP